MLAPELDARGVAGLGAVLAFPPGRTSLLRAKPSKDGDAELRDYRDASHHVRRAASAMIVRRRLFVCMTPPPATDGPDTLLRANPSKDGDAELRDYRD